MDQEILAVSDDGERYVITAGTQAIPGTKEMIEMGQVINLSEGTLSGKLALASILMSMGEWLEYTGPQDLLPKLLAQVKK